METLGKEQKELKIFFCEKCNFKCSKKFNWKRHLMTCKHKEEVNGKEQKEQKEQKDKKEQIHTCICGKTYTNASGLWKHKKVCKIDEINVNNSNTTSNDKSDKLIEFLMKENKEIKELILEIVKNGTHNTTTTNNNTHTNSHNKAFNLNFFLNETCKNAMNITDFVDSIKLQLTDLMDVGELGYVEGISKIIVKNLNNLDETIRPIQGKPCM